MYCKVWCHNFFSHLLQSLKMNMRIENPATYEVQLVIRFLKSNNVCLVLIHMQIVEVCGEGAKNEGNVSKWCCLFKEGSTMCSHTSPLIYAHQWTVQLGNFWASSSIQSIFLSSDYHLFLHLKIIINWSYESRLCGCDLNWNGWKEPSFKVVIINIKITTKQGTYLVLHADSCDKYFTVPGHLQDILQVVLLHWICEPWYV